MTNGLIQHITVEESTSIQWVNIINFLCNSYIISAFQTVEEFGGVDILVSNAAVNPVFGPIFDVSNTIVLVFGNLPVKMYGAFISSANFSILLCYQYHKC